MTDRWTFAVDVGASATKAVLLEDGVVRARAVRRSGADFAAAAGACREEVLAAAGLKAADVAATVATGYGRRSVEFAARAVTEITCHARGCYASFPRAITIVDIGGQDNKVIRVDTRGRHVHFRMNRKCAAGTGAFLEEIALRLGLAAGDLNALAAQAAEGVRLGSFCTVFAKTEILTHLREGVPVSAIVRGAFSSVVNRIVEMDPLDGEVFMSGGVAAHNPVIVEILSERLGRQVLVPPHPQFAGALGAALLASRPAITPQGEEAHAGRSL